MAEAVKSRPATFRGEFTSFGSARSWSDMFPMKPVKPLYEPGNTGWSELFSTSKLVCQVAVSAWGSCAVMK